MSEVAPLDDHECWLLRRTLEERYGRPVEPDLVETELRLDPFSSELTPCPAFYWAIEGAHFVVCKSGDSRYRAQFFYGVNQQFGTGIDEFDNLSECVVTLLQVQADHAAGKRS